jgi:hypothetical protein
MMSSSRAPLALAAALLVGMQLTSATARAEWLTLGSRTISRADSADPDAPVTGYHFGPRATASLGTDVSLLTLETARRQTRLGFSGFLAVEDATLESVLPSELGRSHLALSAAWGFIEPLPRTLPESHELELGVEIGRRHAFGLDGFVLRDPYASDDVPFGAGGTYFGLDGALRSPLGARVSGTARLTARAYVNALPDAVGQVEASDHVADALEEGAELSLSMELGARFALTPQVVPVVRLYLEAIQPHDDYAKSLWLSRLLLGLSLPGAQLELQPYFDAEAGRGSGLLVNRTELRFGGGIRLYAH